MVSVSLSGKSFISLVAICLGEIHKDFSYEQKKSFTIFTNDNYSPNMTADMNDNYLLVLSD